MERDDAPQSEVIQIPKGKPYILIVFESPGSANAAVRRENGVTPAQVLAISEFMKLEAAYNFEQSFKAGQRILPVGRA